MTVRRLIAVTALTLVTAVSGRAQRSTPRLLVLNKDDATFAAVDPASGRVLGTVPVGDGPHELVASAVAAQGGDAALAEAEDLAGLRAGGDAHLQLAVERRHLPRRAEQRRRNSRDGVENRLSKSAKS